VILIFEFGLGPYTAAAAEKRKEKGGLVDVSV
jgi:hypothetical protein